MAYYVYPSRRPIRVVCIRPPVLPKMRLPPPPPSWWYPMFKPIFIGYKPYTTQGKWY